MGSRNPSAHKYACGCTSHRCPLVVLTWSNRTAAGAYPHLTTHVGHCQPTTHPAAPQRQRSVALAVSLPAVRARSARWLQRYMQSISRIVQRRFSIRLSPRAVRHTLRTRLECTNPVFAWTISMWVTERVRAHKHGHKNAHSVNYCQIQYKSHRLPSTVRFQVLRVRPTQSARERARLALSCPAL